MGFEIITKRCPSAAGLGLEPRYIAPEAIVRPIRRPRKILHPQILSNGDGAGNDSKENSSKNLK